jgi:hypothetical protein
MSTAPFSRRQRPAKTCATLQKLKTEGTGFEPATGFPASDFESDR